MTKRTFLSLLRSHFLHILQEHAMYDFYPEWGPARNRDEHEPQPAVRRPRYWTADGPEARDAELQRPDDN